MQEYLALHNVLARPFIDRRAPADWLSQSGRRGISDISQLSLPELIMADRRRRLKRILSTIKLFVKIFKQLLLILCKTGFDRA